MFEHKKILLLGFARSGYEAAKVLAKRENTIILNDGKEEAKQDATKVLELREMGVEFVFGSHPVDLLDESFDYLIKNPGVPIDHPYVLKARELDIPVINEVEMAFQLFPEGVTLVGITGTNGKTTTTTLIYEILKKAGKKVHLAGNIGFPLCSFLSKLESGDIIVMEVSCQQLENVDTFRPHIAVMTNLSPAHLDFLKSYDNYKRVKAKLFSRQTREDIAIVNMEDEDVLMQTKDILSTTKYFSSQNVINGAYYQEGKLFYYDEEILSVNDAVLTGRHNYENMLAAIMVSKELGVDTAIIREALLTFKGVEHRLEYVTTIQGRKFYNDSKATNNKSTSIALSAFTDPTILIMGGTDRNQDFAELKPFLSHVKAVMCYGENKKKIQAYMEDQQIPVRVFDCLTEATQAAYQDSKEGDIILLSPATASWDQYSCFEERGEEFKKIIKELEL